MARNQHYLTFQPTLLDKTLRSILIQITARRSILNDLEVYKFNLSAFEKTIYSVMNNQWNLTHNGRLQYEATLIFRMIKT